MSRICVKNLPPYASEEKLRGLFSQVGDITDVKIARRKDGKSRQFAFVGFKEEASGPAAIKAFNKSFLDATRIAVEAAQAIGDDSVLQRAWSRHTKAKAGDKGGKGGADAAGAAAAGGSSKAAGGAAASSSSSSSKPLRDAVAAAMNVKDTGKLEEYLSVARSSAKRAVWANDDLATATAGVKDTGKAGKAGGPAAKAGEEEEAEEAALAAAEAAALAAKKQGKRRGKKAAGADDDDEDDGASTDSGEYQDVDHDAADHDDSDAEDEDAAAGSGSDSDDDADADDDAKPSKGKAAAGGGALSDLDFLKSKVKRNFDSDSDGEDDAVDGSDADAAAADDADSADDDDDPEDARAPRKRSAKATAPAAAAAAGDEVENATGAAADASADDEAVAPPADAAPAPAADDDRDEDIDVGETGRLFIRNLPYSATEEEVRAHFSRWGKLADARLVRDAVGRSKGYAYVLFMIPEQAVAALAGSDGHVFQGRILHVLPAQPERDKPATAAGEGEGEGGATGKKAGGAGSSFKTKQEAKRKAAAVSGDDPAAAVWSSLFIRADVTVAAMAERLGVSRSDVLDRDASNVAVRMALAETALVAETREFLKGEGIDLAALEAHMTSAAAGAAAAGGKPAVAPSSAAVPKRSETVMIVKNLPFSAELSAVRDLFGRFGTLLRCVMPRTRAIAVVEYADARVAKRAFAALAYSRFQRTPIYLEWAPEGVFSAPAPAAASGSAAADASAASTSSAVGGAGAVETATGGVKRKRPAEEPAAAAPSDAAAGEDAASTSAAAAGAPVAADGRTIYAKNLAWETTEAALRELFATVGPLRSVRIPKRRNPKYKPAPASGVAPASGAQQEWLSMGYGFVEFVRAADAQEAIKRLQGKTLDEHALQLKIAGGDDGAGGSGAAPKAKRARTTEPAPADASSTKLLVRNLAFEATKKDVQELFNAFGTIKTVRLPSKFNGSHRGFAFVEFLTHSEALAAKEALASTHLYGRHLAIEWASAADDKTAGVGAGAPAAAAAPAAASSGGGVAGARGKKGAAAAPASGAPGAAAAAAGKRMTFDADVEDGSHL